MGELGKVDLGGGGTIALYLARYGMDVWRRGVRLLKHSTPAEWRQQVDIIYGLTRHTRPF
jgi:hypothetical protein